MSAVFQTYDEYINNVNNSSICIWNLGGPYTHTLSWSFHSIVLQFVILKNRRASKNKSKKKKHMLNQLCQPIRGHNTFSIEQMKFQQYL